MCASQVPSNPLNGASSLGNVERESVGIPYVTARQGWILFNQDTTGRQQTRFCRWNIRHQQVEHGALLFSALDVKAERAGFEANDVCRPAGDSKTEHRRVELYRLRKSASTNDDVSC